MRRWFPRNTWRSVPITIDYADGGSLVVRCDMPIVAGLMRPREYPLTEIYSVQDAVVGSSAGFRLVTMSGEVIYVWFARAREVISDLARLGVYVIGGVRQKRLLVQSPDDYEG